MARKLIIYIFINNDKISLIDFGMIELEMNVRS